MTRQHDVLFVRMSTAARCLSVYRELVASSQSYREEAWREVRTPPDELFI